MGRPVFLVLCWGLEAKSQFYTRPAPPPRPHTPPLAPTMTEIFQAEIGKDQMSAVGSTWDMPPWEQRRKVILPGRTTKGFLKEGAALSFGIGVREEDVLDRGHCRSRAGNALVAGTVSPI